ncbi:MAG: class I SAM-dependent methyltransferase [Deltaproteobacteria bacterium]|nr:class I SAM-dependent methyltransferase [Deltaproteobacteria bacterium]
MVQQDVLETFKATQRVGWAFFAPLENLTTPTAANLVRFAGVRAGQTVLDVGCGTGVVAVTAARKGARVAGLDLTPELLERAHENSRIAGVEIAWREGDAEKLPFGDAAFDVVVSQFGHMFAPRPEVALGEMLRVLKPGGTIAFSTWPPDHFMGQMFALFGRYLPAPPPGVTPPPLWGKEENVRAWCGGAVKDLSFERGVMLFPALSPGHHRESTERTTAGGRKVVELLASDRDRMAAFRTEYHELVAKYLEDNVVRQEYLMSRATKV